MPFTPEDLESFSTEQRQIHLIRNKLSEIISKNPPSELDRERSAFGFAYLFGDQERKNTGLGSYLNIYHSPKSGPLGTDFSAGNLYASTQGIEQLKGPIFVLDGKLNSANDRVGDQLNTRMPTPWGLLPLRFTDSTNTLISVFNDYVIDADGGYKLLMILNQGYARSFEEQLQMAGIRDKDNVPHIDREFKDEEILLPLSGSDIENINHELSLIESGQLVLLNIAPE